MSVLKIHMTYQCTATCEHCRFKCIIDSAPFIDFDMAMRCVTELKRLNNLDLVVLFGGEPGLFSELTHALTAAIRQLGIAVRIETQRVLCDFRRAGVHVPPATICARRFSHVQPRCISRRLYPVKPDQTCRQEVREALQRRYPEELTPAQHYIYENSGS